MKKSVDLYTVGSDASLAPEIQMLRIVSSGLAAQAVNAFTVLGGPDALKSGALTISDLASRLEAHLETLSRLLRFLSSIDVVRQEGETFALTALGRTLCSRPRSAIRDNTLLMGSDFYWAAIGALSQQVKTGRNAFQNVFGVDLFAYLSTHGESQRIFNAAMDSSTDLGVAGILSAYDFSECREIVDVGGGKGAFLKAMLRRNRDARGCSYDSPAVLRDFIPDAELGSRLTTMPGDFFESVPAGADTFVLRRVLHDWNDEKALQILRNCRKAMSPRARLLVIELAPENSMNNWAALDLLMMLLQDGKERTERDMRGILTAAGLEATRVLTTDGPYWIFEAVLQPLPD